MRLDYSSHAFGMPSICMASGGCFQVQRYLRAQEPSPSPSDFIAAYSKP